MFSDAKARSNHFQVSKPYCFYKYYAWHIFEIYSSPKFLHYTVAGDG